ncbi:SusC/RagA family TonB-linked outer membrane protein [Tenacibaculum finnmarkense]|uniref:SusC/RagA family TonB-linked outer membrane protein n=1 Tax=Tenacibaculum finnmarkense TaxID=2781243 RepID=UPI00187B1D90|nr:SusC/RagA family TonB-linked outer membrane protein [Tenacibaculum finnmarkense]MBE7634815.1 SusC/RagA family TonB-linked outer membrane protein [Tenacibaculum finnmarkense genomovar ulcerans]MCD8401143.1 SusC/RagA family TonB-linked outer membrane protein [Tenacibaculum finnmarkense genomovar ulcerans]MCD8430844.1 SusC/RagA family TonB-linked outer membrane protein [Tenacibaculum finnmarkense genomovar ulcerans]MCG8786335.1 SusC/RagA family TonB-linked outer membrane protein [Tenacibaculum 
MKTKFNGILTLLLALIVQFSFAQDRTISGIVSDESGPLPGVTVLKKGTTQGTETDFDGKYTIKSKTGEILVFNFVGMKTIQKTVGTSNQINIVMENDNVLDEVVVTALGIKREKKSLGYASQEIKSDAINGGTTKTGNIASQLSGKVAGLNVTTTNNFGGSSNMVIRGVKSLGGGSPLIVIDGSPINNSSTFAGGNDYGNALSDINQDDIASMNILKGAAASALYGERGINGVIVITTKNGKSGDDNSWGIKFSSGITVGTIDKATFPEYQNTYGGGYGQGFDHGNDYTNYDSDGSGGPKYDGSLKYHWDAFDTTSPNFGKKRAYVAAKNGPSSLFKTSFTKTNSISIQKGDQSKNMTFTYENFDSDWILPNSELEKNNFSLKVNYDLTPKLHTSFYSSLTLQDTQGRNTTGYSDNLMSMFRQWWNVDVDVLEQKDSYFRNKAIASADNRYGNISWNRKSPTNSKPAYWNNPYFQLYENAGSDNRYRSFSYGRITYDINDNLGVTGKVAYDKSMLNIEKRIAAGSIAMDFGASGNTVPSGYSRQDIARSETNLDLMLNYNYELVEDIKVSGVLGANLRKNDYNSIYASTEGGLVVPGIYSLANTVKSPLAATENQYNTETNSAYLTASFDFYKKFYLDATWRLDKSSTLPAANNTYNYPSVTGALIVSEFYKPEWLSFWKVRANYAEVGSTADPYELQNSYASAGLLNGVGLYDTNYTKKNSNLKPQRSKEYEFGTEMMFLNKRITLDFAYYNTKTFDQIISLPVSTATGYSKKVVNAGQINNSGFEAQLGLVAVKNDNFTWNIDLNWSKNKNKVISLSGDSENYQLASYNGGVSLNAFKGKPWGTLIGPGYVEDKNGNKVLETYQNKEKTKTYARYKRVGNKNLGNVTPDWIGGMRNSFTYKNFGFSFLIDVRKGGKVFSTDMYYGLGTGLYKETVGNNVRQTGVVLPGVFEDGTKNTFIARDPQAYGAVDGWKVNPSEAFVYDGGFVKLREAAISYSLPKSALKNSFINDAKISLVGRNLWIISKDLPYADPEAMVGGGTRSYGHSIGSTPTTRDIGLNLTFKF